MDCDAIRLKSWPQLLQGRFRVLRDLERVGGILFRHIEDDAGRPLDRGTADGRFGGLNDVGHIRQRDARGSPAQEDRPGNVVRFEGLPLGLEDDPLIPGVDEACSPHAG